MRDERARRAGVVSGADTRYATSIHQTEHRSTDGNSARNGSKFRESSNTGKSHLNRKKGHIMAQKINLRNSDGITVVYHRNKTKKTLLERVLLA